MVIVRLLLLLSVIALIKGYLEFKVVDENGQNTSHSGLLLAYNPTHGWEWWGTVCDDNYSANSARVACLDMGYPGSSWWENYVQWSIQSSYDIVVNEFICDSSARTYTDCTFTYSAYHNCQHSEDVFLTCNSPCPANSFLNMLETRCDPCPAGVTSPGGRTAASCECPAGRYWSSTLLDCLQCPQNTFSSYNSASCQACPNGSTSEPGSVNSVNCSCFGGMYHTDETCLPCPENHFSEKGSTNCTKCPAFTKSSPGSESCSSCLLGQFWDNYTCTYCPEHMFGNRTACLECPKWYSLSLNGSCFVRTESDQLQKMPHNFAESRNILIIAMSALIIVLVIIIAGLVALFLKKRCDSQNNPQKQISLDHLGLPQYTCEAQDNTTMDDATDNANDYEHIYELEDN